MRQTALTLLLLIGTVSSSLAATLHVYPRTALYDQPVRIWLTGVPAHAAVTLRLATTDAHGVSWRSQATFRSDASGPIDLTKNQPIAGSYSTADPMGLFWSMKPLGDKDVSYANPATQELPPTRLKAVIYKLIATIHGKQIAQIALSRQLVTPGLSVTHIREKGLIANLYVPPGMRRDGHQHAAVITLGGAEGGLAGGDALARWLASHGFVTLALGWYHMPGRNNDLIRVPIVRLLGHAVDYLSSLDFVDRQRIGAMGGSWGGISALAAAPYIPRIHAVVSAVGSPVVFPGIARDRKTGGFHATDKPPFTLHGNAMPFARLQSLLKYMKSGDLAAIRSAVSPIWKIKGPILFVAGGDDRLGLSAPMARLGLSVLKQHGHPFHDDAEIYPNAGHVIWPGYRPTLHLEKSPPGIPPVGGNPKGYAHADAAFGPDVLQFLRRALGSDRLQHQAAALSHSR